MKCPVCEVPTYVVEYEKIELDLCPDCRGLWFDHGELELLLGHDPVNDLSETATEEDSRDCPLCRHTLMKVNIGPSRRVMVDTCPEGCGVWFDKNELADLAGHLAEDGWHVPAPLREFLSGMFPTKGEE